MTRSALFCAVLILTFLTTACGTESSSETDGEESWQLVWSDEFDGTAGTVPNSDNWTYDIGRGSNGWGNQELQYYTDRPENASLDGDGNLVITAIRESFGGASYTSARILTQDLFEQQYGRFEARLKTPYGPGIWPAFWMLGSNFETVGWPTSGEIDIMELRGQEPSKIAGSIHGPGFFAGNAITRSYTLPDGRFDTDYHLFAIEWSQDKIDFYVDDVRYQTITRADVSNRNGTWVFDQPFFMIMNIAVGGTYVGPPSQQTTFPQEMVIDYVRVYSKAE
ncbi:glycoside hydrolase family 16 protein [Rhodohalobacter mucosus]|uniref:Glycosyl hydrolase family 16 n=1 Tax=Rhodohalobacter mucosus TaxID=2079485 RepID=A0A316TRA0_9BACT|nr:glycoside hydrolase family 16 protein [Rhodohalobacter mucosus]PWN06221.1 glycosyl hydrolase family 16 [Rhodohalobacter mucosus]